MKPASTRFYLTLVLTFLILFILLVVLISSYDFFIKYTIFIFSLIISILLFYIHKNDKDTFLNKVLINSLDFIEDHLVVTDRNGTIIYINKKVEDITGFKRKSLLGQKAGTRINWGGEMGSKFYKKMWSTLLKNKVFSNVIKNKRKNGEMYDAHISIYPVGNKYFLAIEKDITHEKELDKMKTDFISLASHQLRTPLSAMKWYLEMLLDGDAGLLSGEQKSFVQNINNSNERMIELVNSLLNISRVESGRLIIDPKNTNIIEVVEDVISDVKPKAKERGITFMFEGVPSLPLIFSDPKLIRNVYMNLLSNAIKYTPSGGSVTLKISKNTKDIINEIIDTGMGIPEKDQAKIFTRFFRAENARGKVTDGNGLGLYLVKSIVEVCGGKIWFESVENKGTKFTFTLPLKGISAKKGEVYIDS